MQIFGNVFVDSFKLKKSNSVYFLTHWHADHYWGLTTKWEFGPIYCSIVTRKIMLTKYPKLSEVAIGLQLNKTHKLHNAEGIQFQATLFDSNHIAGSVIILFKAPGQRYVLHTGDMRFNHHWLQRNPELFHFDQKIKQYRCNYKIDTLFLDNTYCDPIFMFPNRSDALQMVKSIIDAHGPGTRKFYLVTDSIGKQEAFVGLSLHYKVLVTLWTERMNYVKQMYSKQVLDKLFCSKSQSQQKGSWIQVIKRRYVDNTLKDDQRAIAIKLTGWANLQDSHPLSQRQYIVPYSLHSNYEELQLFMSVIRPVNMLPVVRLNHHGSQKFRQNFHSYNSYFGSLCHMKQRGFNFFAANYLDIGFKDKNTMRNSISVEKKKPSLTIPKKQSNKFQNEQNLVNEEMKQCEINEMISSQEQY